VNRELSSKSSILHGPVDQLGQFFEGVGFVDLSSDGRKSNIGHRVLNGKGFTVHGWGGGEEGKEEEEGEKEEE
jgi:hypothetical protein